MVGLRGGDRYFCRQRKGFEVTWTAMVRGSWGRVIKKGWGPKTCQTYRIVSASSFYYYYLVCHNSQFGLVGPGQWFHANIEASFLMSYIQFCIKHAPSNNLWVLKVALFPSCFQGHVPQIGIGIINWLWGCCAILRSGVFCAWCVSLVQSSPVCEQSGSAVFIYSNFAIDWQGSLVKKHNCLHSGLRVSCST